MRLKTLLSESPESDVRMAAYQLEAALKKFGALMNKMSPDSVSHNYKPISQAYDVIADEITRIRKLLQ